MSDPTPLYLIIHPSKLKEGWLELKGCIARQRNFKVLGVNADGNYVVENPQLVIDQKRDKDDL